MFKWLLINSKNFYWILNIRLKYSRYFYIYNEQLNIFITKLSTDCIASIIL